MTEVKTLQELGFERAAANVQHKIELQKKMHIAYQNFEFITPDDVDQFNKRLYQETMVESNNGRQRNYKELVMIAPRDYAEVPPADVLEKMAKAKELGCFDYFEIAKIEARQEVKDPILFGRIDGCGDRFFVAQWDNDVTMDMIKAARPQ